MINQELENLIVTKLEERKIDFSNPSNIVEFFDEDFSDYERLYDEA